MIPTAGVPRWRARLGAVAVLAAPTVLAAPGAGRAQESPAGPADVARAIIAADNARDLAAVMALYAGDAELWPPGEPPVRGADAIEARYREIFAGSRPRLRTVVLRVREAEGWALVEGEVHGTVSPAAGGEPVRVNDKYLMVVVRSPAGGWRIARLMWSGAGPG